MKTGTKSLLFGVHQFIWHPLAVYLSWVLLYRKLPTWREAICIFIHDWGYWGKENMDDENGERHPEFAAAVADALLDRNAGAKTGPQAIGNRRHHDLCLFHSRHYARNAGRNPSELCWADKLSIIFEPWWFYLPRAWASGELYEYRRIAAECGFVDITSSHRTWFAWTKQRLLHLGRSMRCDSVPYINSHRSSACQ